MRLKQRTAAKQRDISEVLPNALTWHLLRYELQRSGCDQVNGKTKGCCMEEEFVHDHMCDHNHRKDDGKKYGHKFSTLQATLECQEAIHHWCRQKMHGQFIRWR